MKLSKDIIKKPQAKSNLLSGINIPSVRLGNKDEEASGIKILELNVDNIVEDENQPRTQFSEDGLLELATSITERGLKTPISVRKHPSNNNKYIINHGARRYRAAILADKKTIPAIIDEDYLFIDQIAENVVRENLTVKEIVSAFKKLLSQGMKQVEIAEKLGKSKTYVSNFVKLSDLSPDVKRLLDDELCNDAVLLSNIERLYKKHPTEVSTWINKQDSFSRDHFAIFKHNIENGENIKHDAQTIPDEELQQEEVKKEKNTKDQNLTKLKKLQVNVLVNDEPGILVLNKRPSEPGRAFVKLNSTGKEEDVSLSLVIIEELTEII